MSGDIYLRFCITLYPHLCSCTYKRTRALDICTYMHTHLWLERERVVNIICLRNHYSYLWHDTLIHIYIYDNYAVVRSYMWQRTRVHAYLCIYMKTNLYLERDWNWNMYANPLFIFVIRHIYSYVSSDAFIHLCGMMIDVYIHTRGMTHWLNHFHVLQGTLSYVWRWREIELFYTRDNKLLICVR